MSNAARRVFWVIIIALLLLTRIPNAARYFSIDNVNLALALDNFDPLNHQPQPPGYPFFVAFSRFVNFFARDASRTFLFISVLVTGLCLPLTVAVGRQLFTQRAGYAAALLLLLNPAFWQTGIDGPLRPFLALFSLSTAYCCWRAWKGEAQFVLWGAVSLGVGSGFRPDLLAYLGLFWLLTSIVGVRSFKAIAQGAAILVGIMAVWIGGLAYAVGGVSQLYSLTTSYLVDQTKAQSVVFGAAQAGFMRQLSRLVIWNGLAVVGWIWAIPFAISKERLHLWRSQRAFLAIWLIPGLIFQVLVHVDVPGHTLFSIPALCVIGGCVAWFAAERLMPSDPSPIADVAVLAASVLNVLLFLNFFPLPAAPATGGVLQSVKNATAYAIYESSLAWERSLDEVADTTMKELTDFTGPSAGKRPWVIVTTDETPKEWFMHWLLMRYYVPDAPIWVAAEGRTPRQALYTKAGKTLETKTGDIIEIPVPRGGRVVWVLESGSPFQQELHETEGVHAGRRVDFMDIPDDARPFRVRSFEFVPTSQNDNGIQ